MSKKNIRITKSLTLDPETLDFLEAYAKSTGSNNISAANEQLVRQGASNIDAMNAMNERYIAAIISLENRIAKMEEKDKSNTNRLASLLVANIKLSGSTKQGVSSLMLKENFTPTEIEMEMKRGIKFAIESMSTPKKEEDDTYDY